MVKPMQNIEGYEDNNSISIDIIEKLDRVAILKPTNYIYKVHEEMRSANKKAYEPVLVSIGPYHHKRRSKDLKYMEDHKLRNLKNLIKWVEEETGVSRADQLRRYLGILGALEGEARGYYSEAINIKKAEFLEMLLLDGYFIIEYFRIRSLKGSHKEAEMNVVFEADWIHLAMSRDLILIENQIPFFVLEKLHSALPNALDSLSLLLMAVSSLRVYVHLPEDRGKEELEIAVRSVSSLAKHGNRTVSGSRQLNREKLNDTKHLLDLLRNFMLIEETLEIKEDNIQYHRRVEEEVPLSVQKYTYSARELRDLGVIFKYADKGKFYDIKFDKGILEIPIIRIQDDTEVRFRNLIAYEQHACYDGVKYVGDYMGFMDGLIDSPTDVKLLRRAGIIQSLVGGDEVISTMFNMIGKGVILGPDFYYKRIVRDLTKHCQKRRNVWKAKFVRNYLSSPWTIFSLVAASLLLVLTIMETVYEILSYYNA